MFSKLSTLALVAPLVAGLTLQVPTNPVTAGQITIKWTNAAGDPDTFSLELVNEAFHNSFAIANNVIPDNGEITVTLPPVPIGDGYTLEAVNIGNINDVFSTTAPFSVGPNPSASQVPTGSSTTSGASSATSVTTAVSSTQTGTVTTTRPVTSSTPVGSTVTTRSSGTSSGTGSSTGTSSATSGGASTTNSSSAVSALKMNTNVGAFAAVLFSAIAGAAIIVL